MPESSRPQRPVLQPAGVWRYLDTHHADFGVALFIVPCIVVALVLMECVNALVWLAG